MSQIVVTTIGSLGDLHPLIAIGLGLRDRGHNIIFATVKDYRSKIESLGFKFHALRPDYIAVDDPEMLARMMDLQKGTERVVRDYLLANLHDTYTDLMNVAQNADFIVANEVVYAARIVAEKLKIRWAFCAMAPGSFFSAYDPFVLPPFPALSKLRTFGPAVNGSVKSLAKFMTRSWGEPIHQLRQELGLSPVGNPIIDDKFSPHLVLALFSISIRCPSTGLGGKHSCNRVSFLRWQAIDRTCAGTQTVFGRRTSNCFYAWFRCCPFSWRFLSREYQSHKAVKPACRITNRQESPP